MIQWTCLLNIGSVSLIFSDNGGEFIGDDFYDMCGSLT